MHKEILRPSIKVIDKEDKKEEHPFVLVFECFNDIGVMWHIPDYHILKYYFIGPHKDVYKQ